MVFYSKGRTNSLLNITPVFVAKYIDMQFFSGSWRKCFFTQGKKLTQIFDYDTSKWNIVAGKNGVQGGASVVRHRTGSFLGGRYYSRSQYFVIPPWA